jgi:hypothetical protein
LDSGFAETLVHPKTPNPPQDPNSPQEADRASG